MKGVIVGLGSIAQKHIQALYTFRKDISLFAIRSGHSDHNIAEVVNLTAAQLEDQPFDFAIISNPTYQHTQALSQLLPLEIPLLIEKPLFQKIGEAELALIEQVNKKSVLNYVACNLRFHPCI